MTIPYIATFDPGTYIYVYTSIFEGRPQAENPIGPIKTRGPIWVPGVYSCDPNVGFVVGFPQSRKVRNHDHTIHVNMYRYIYIWSPPPPGPTFSHPRRGRCHRDMIYIYTSTFQSGCQLNPKRC